MLQERTPGAPVSRLGQTGVDGLESAAALWTNIVSNRERMPAGERGQRLRGMAQRLREAGRRDLGDAPLVRAVLAGLGPQRSVADLGAGPGRYTRVLARQDCRVWAVEPSEDMRRYLQEDLAGEDPATAARVQVVAGAWPDVAAQVPPVEVALASLVIHFCPDATGFIAAMERLATRRCVLSIRVGQMQPLIEVLWPQFHPDRPLPAQPVFAHLYNVLLEQGIVADVAVHAATGAGPAGMRYADQDEAVQQLGRALQLTSAEEHARLAAALEGLLCKDGDTWRSVQPPPREAVVSWRPGDRVSPRAASTA